jgi:hypothetical protein
MLAQDLIDRLSARAANPKTRKDAPDWQTELADANLITINTPFGAVTAACGLKHGPQPEPAPPPLAAPASPTDIASAEKRLGFALPDDLKQLYSTIANGGFGPGSGLIPLDEMVAYQEELSAEPQGEGGQPWPARLLPFNRYQLCCDCYNVETGEIVFWDEETLLGGPSDRVWNGSFKKTAHSLSAYLEAWLETAPPKSYERYVNAADVGFPESDVVIDMWTVNELRQSIEVIRQTPEDRKAWGLPEEGWEEELCKARGLDPKVYLEMIKRPATDEEW